MTEPEQLHPPQDEAPRELDGLSLVTIPIGMAVGELALATVFFAVLLPIGVVLRRAQPNFLQLKLDRQARSYWERKRAPGDAASYLRLW